MHTVMCAALYQSARANTITYIHVCIVICVHSTDGAEMLLDLGLPAALIGGIVLPLLGAIPDAAMIIASGVGGSREEANKQISVGMGYVLNGPLHQH